MTGELREAGAPVWPWCDSLDALIAAPKHHTLLFENERVRALETRVLPGEVVPVHTHRWPSVMYFLSWSDFVRRGANGEVLVDSRPVGAVGADRSPPSVVWSAALAPHSLENVGSSEIRVIGVELKQGA